MYCTIKCVLLNNKCLFQFLFKFLKSNSIKLIEKTKNK